MFFNTIFVFQDPQRKLSIIREIDSIYHLDEEAMDWQNLSTVIQFWKAAAVQCTGSQGTAIILNI